MPRFITTQPYDFAADPESLQEESVVHGQVDIVSEMAGRPIQAHPGRVTFSCRVQPKTSERPAAPAVPNNVSQ